MFKKIWYFYEILTIEPQFKRQTWYHRNHRYLHMWRYDIFTCEDIVSFLPICYHSLYHWLLYNKEKYPFLRDARSDITWFTIGFEALDLYIFRKSYARVWIVGKANLSLNWSRTWVKRYPPKTFYGTVFRIYSVRYAVVYVFI